jgi:hypothetical protein
MELTLRNIKGSELTYDEGDNNLLYLELNSNQYMFVKGDDTPANNGTKLSLIYSQAIAKTPYGNPLSTTNRFTVIVGPGKYDTNLVLSAPYVDLISLTGNRDVRINGNFSVENNDIYVRGIYCEKLFSIMNNYPLTKIENCKSTDAYSFGREIKLTSTLIKCECLADYSFNWKGTTSGILTDCIGGNKSFDFDGTAAGTYTNCVGGNYSFGSTLSSGVFTNCVGGDYCFASEQTASGTFNNCVGGLRSFAGEKGIASGTFTNCVAGAKSFAQAGTQSGTLYFCRMSTSKFNTSGRIYYSINGDGTSVNTGGGAAIKDPSG